MNMSIATFKVRSIQNTNNHCSISTARPIHIHPPHLIKACPHVWTTQVNSITHKDRYFPLARLARAPPCSPSSETRYYTRYYCVAINWPITSPYRFSSFNKAAQATADQERIKLIYTPLLPKAWVYRIMKTFIGHAKGPLGLHNFIGWHYLCLPY